MGNSSISPIGLYDIRSTKDAAHNLAQKLINIVQTHETEIAERLNNLILNSDQTLKNNTDLFKIAKNVHKYYLDNGIFRLPRYRGTISDSTISRLLGEPESSVWKWNNRKSGVILLSIIRIYDFITHFFEGTSFANNLLSYIGSNYDLPIGNSGPLTQPNMFRRELKKLIMSYEKEIIDYLTNHPIKQLPSPHQTLICQELIDKYTEDHAYLDCKIFKRNPDGLIPNTILSFLIGVSRGAIKDWSHVNFITSNNYQIIEDYVTKLFDAYTLGTSLKIFKLELDAINRAPTVLTEKIVREQLIHYFRAGKRLYKDISPNSMALFGVDRYKPLVEETLFRLLTENSFLMDLRFNFSLNELNQFPDLLMIFDLLKPSYTIYNYFYLNTIYAMIFGHTTISWHKIMDDAKKKNFEIELTIADWISMVMEARLKDEDPSYIKLSYVCDKCGQRNSIMVLNLIYEDQRCPICSKGKNEKVTGAMLEILLLQLIDRYGDDIELLEVDSLVPSEQLFEDKKGMIFDYYVKLRIGQGKDAKIINWIIESDGKQHRDDGVGFLSKLGLICRDKGIKLLEISKSLTLKRRREIARLPNPESIKKYIDDLRDKFDIKEIFRHYEEWVTGLKNDKQKNNLFNNEDDVRNIFLSRIPTWDRAPRITQEEQSEILLEGFIKTLKDSGIGPDKIFPNLRHDFMRTMVNSGIDWNGKITELSEFGLWMQEGSDDN